MPGFPLLYCPLKIAQTHVHWAYDSIQQFILCCLIFHLPSIFLSIRVFSNEWALHIRWLKYWSFNFSISTSNEYSHLISFRTDWFDFLQSKRLSRVFSNTTIQQHQFFGTQPSLWSNSHIHNDYWKNHSLTICADIL